MAELVLSLGGSILSTLSKAMDLWEQKHMNEEIQGELEQFMRELQYNIRHLQEKSLGSRLSNTTSWALDSLQKDLEIADLDAKNILNKGFLRSVWDANKIRSKLETLRERVMTSFQTRLILALLDVAVESQQGQEIFQTAMLNMNKELVELYSSKADQSLKKSMQDVIRKELQAMLNPLMASIKSDGRSDIESSISMIRNTSAQTSEMEKFFEDVLAGLDGVLKQSSLSKKDEGPPVLVKEEVNYSQNRHHRDGPKWYQDPITWETMCDPVKANDGHTYDRWTILRHSSSMGRSPFMRDEKNPLVIEMDDISIRSHLFQKFGDQVAKFKAERDAYRNAALQAVNNGNFGESLVMLNNVLAWDPQDAECSTKRDHVQCQLDEGTLSSTSSSSSVQIKATYGPFLTKGKSTQNIVKEGGNQNFGEKDESVVGIRPERFDRASVDNKAVVLSTDGLTAVYKLAKCPGAAVRANAPCPTSHCYPFYFEVLVHPSSDNCEQDVAVGFNIGGVELRGGLGTYSGSCGYYALQGKVRYLGASGTPSPNDSVNVHYPRANASATSHKKGGYVVGAGFHRGTGIVFFMLDGNVVALLEATRFSCDQMQLFPVVSLHSSGAKVTANFGPTWVSREPPIAGFTTLMENIPIGIPSIWLAVMTKQAVPMRTNVFYCEILFDISILKAGGDGDTRASIGFAGTLSSTFLKTGRSGGYYNSCGLTFSKPPCLSKIFCDINFHCHHIWQNGEIETDDLYPILKQDKNSTFYRLGVGIHYGTNEIFFTKDGCFLYSVRNKLQCRPVNAVLVVRADNIGPRIIGIPWQTCVGHCNWISLPSKLQHSLCSAPKFMTTLDHPQGLKARHIGFVKDNHNDASQYFGVAAFRADLVAPLQSHAHDTGQKPFYFELMVAHQGDDGYIAIGFSHFQHFRDSEQLGCYDYSCAYHGNTGKLFTGTHSGRDFGPTFTAGDRVGAGFNHHTNTIFFVKNGEVVGSTANMMGSCALYPAVGLGSYGQEVHLNVLGFDHPFSEIRAGRSPTTTPPASTPLCTSGHIDGDSRPRPLYYRNRRMIDTEPFVYFPPPNRNREEPKGPRWWGRK